MTLLSRDLRRRMAPQAALRALLARRGLIAAPLGAGWRGSLDAIRATPARVPLLMSDAAALQLQIAVRATRRLGGAMAEAGVLMGGSARLICEEKGDAPLHLFDVFELLQTPGDAAGSAAGIRTHFGSTHGTAAEVARLLSCYPAVHLHPGVFPRSTAGLEETRFAFVHIDLDLPEGVRAALDYFHPRMLRGGVLVVDDTNDREVAGVLDAFFAGRGDTRLDLPWGQTMIVPQRAAIARP